MRSVSTSAKLKCDRQQFVSSGCSTLLKRVYITALFLLMVLVRPSSSLATSIVVVAQKDTVLIAADSKSTLMGKEVAPLVTCKIHLGKNLVFASAGNTSVHSEKTVYFDVSALVREIARESKNVREAVDIFTEAVKQPLATSINTLRKQHPHLVPSGPALSTVFATFENDQSLVFLLNFRVRFEESRIVVETDRKMITPAADQHLNVFIGETEKMIEYNAGNPDWASRDAIEGMRHLIGLEIETHPNKVGPPIDIFLLKADGGRWIQSKKDCAERSR